MAKFLKAAHPLQQHGMAQVKVGGCGVKTCLNPKNSTALQTLLKLLSTMQTDAAAGELSDLIGDLHRL